VVSAVVSCNAWVEGGAQDRITVRPIHMAWRCGLASTSPWGYEMVSRYKNTGEGHQPSNGLSGMGHFLASRLAGCVSAYPLLLLSCLIDKIYSIKE